MGKASGTRLREEEERTLAVDPDIEQCDEENNCRPVCFLSPPSDGIQTNPFSKAFNRAGQSFNTATKETTVLPEPKPPSKPPPPRTSIL